MIFQLVHDDCGDLEVKQFENLTDLVLCALNRGAELDFDRIMPSLSNVDFDKLAPTGKGLFVCHPSGHVRPIKDLEKLSDGSIMRHGHLLREVPWEQLSEVLPKIYTKLVAAQQAEDEKLALKKQAKEEKAKKRAAAKIAAAKKLLQEAGEL